MPRTSTDQSKTDHDLLVELAVTTKLNHEATTNQISSVKDDVVEVKDTMALQLARMDARVAVLETFKETKVAEEKIDRWNKTADAVEEHLSAKRVKRVDDSVRFTERVQDRWKFMTPVVLFFVGFLYWLFQSYIVPAIIASFNR